MARIPQPTHTTRLIATDPEASSTPLGETNIPEPRQTKYIDSEAHIVRNTPGNHRRPNACIVHSKPEHSERLSTIVIELS